MWVCANNSHSQLGISSFVQNTKKNLLLNNCRINLVKCKMFGINLGQRGNTHVEDERLMSLSRSNFGSSSTDEKIDESQIMDFKGFHKDLYSLPSRLNVKPLSAIVDPISDGSKIRVAYQGSPGSYSETAALKAYPICKTIPCDKIESVFKAVELLLVDKGILPVENSVGGSIHRNYDLLLRHKLHIVGEVELVVNHCLELTIQDDLESVTRFLILAKEPIIPRTSKAHKTSIVFTLEEGPRVLIKALAVFAIRNINLSKIESRPQRKCPLRSVDDRSNGSPMYFDHLFYIDFEASMAEPRAQYALNRLQEFTTFLRVLGCYPTNTVP